LLLLPAFGAHITIIARVEQTHEAQSLFLFSLIKFIFSEAFVVPVKSNLVLLKLILSLITRFSHLSPRPSDNGCFENSLFLILLGRDFKGFLLAAGWRHI